MHINFTIHTDMVMCVDVELCGSPPPLLLIDTNKYGPSFLPLHSSKQPCMPYCMHMHIQQVEDEPQTAFPPCNREYEFSLSSPAG